MSAIPWTPIKIKGTLRHGDGTIYARTEESFLANDGHEYCFIFNQSHNNTDDTIYMVIYNNLIYLYNNTNDTLNCSAYDISNRGKGAGLYVSSKNVQKVNDVTNIISVQNAQQAYGLSVSTVDPMTFDGNFGEKILIPVRWRGLEDTFDIMIDDEQ
jgi:hypothetical protein